MLLILLVTSVCKRQKKELQHWDYHVNLTFPVCNPQIRIQLNCSLSHQLPTNDFLLLTNITLVQTGTSKHMEVEDLPILK